VCLAYRLLDFQYPFHYWNRGLKGRLVTLPPDLESQKATRLPAGGSATDKVEVITWADGRSLSVGRTLQIFDLPNSFSNRIITDEIPFLPPWVSWNSLVAIMLESLHGCLLGVEAPNQTEPTRQNSNFILFLVSFQVGSESLNQTELVKPLLAQDRSSQTNIPPKPNQTN
jgi:hypothetical protein